MIDPLRERAEFYQLDAAQYQAIQVGADRMYRSRSLPGLWLKINWLWQTPRPHPLEVLGQIAGIEPEAIEQFMNLFQWEF